MFNDIIWGSEDNERECIANATLVIVFVKRFPAGRWSFLGPGSEKKWYSTLECKPQGEGDRIAELMMLNSAKANIQSSDPQVHCLEECSKAKVVENYQYISVPMEIRLKLFFAQFFCFNQLSIYVAVSDSCDECKSCQTGRPVVAGQYDPLFAPADLLIMTLTPSTEVPAQENLLQKYKERVERLPQPDHLIKTCTDAEFLTTVDVGQYFMTKDTEEFSQFTDSVACREYTLPRDEQSSDPKGWIRGNTKIGPVLEVTTSYLQGKMEWKSELIL